MTIELRVDDDESNSRFAVYFFPDTDSDWAKLWTAWLVDPLALLKELGLLARALDCPVAIADMTQVPRLYGFHATLKPPFRLKRGIGYQQLLLATHRFAARFESFDLPELMPTKLADFVALVPMRRSSQADEIACAAVRELDWMRAPMTNDERRKRLSHPLTDRQLRHLLAWGYPHVLEEFQFHMTLTGNCNSLDALQKQWLFSTVCAIHSHCSLRWPSYRSMPFASVCLLEQTAADIPYRLRDRVSLGREN